MPEESPGKALATGIGTIFERVGEFFHIFDLSFFVAGASTFGAIAFAFAHLVYFKLQEPMTLPFDSWAWVAAVIVASYLCGLIAFAGGRGISELPIIGCVFRTRILRRNLTNAIEAHGLSGHPILKDYLKEIKSAADGEKDNIRSRLYVRMWSEVAHKECTPLFVHHLMRYWAMTATYDAVGFSLLVWTVCLIAVAISLPSEAVGTMPCFIGAALCFFSAILALRRGSKYYRYQVEDLAAHFASESK